MNQRLWRPLASAAFLVTLTGLAACTTGGVSVPEGQIDAPGVDLRGDAVDGVAVGHRLIAAGEYELAIKAFNRAALDRGKIDAEILAGLGSASLGLGRLGQAEGYLRRAIETEDAQPEDWNNLGVVLMEAGKTVEAEQIFRRAFALDNGESVAIRDNLRLALAKSENSATEGIETDDYKLVRRGSSTFLIRPTP
ncbi:tetratricopeptide repeat protein [Roseobacter sp. YSTF-M11]|uniref:Tetratricopeptide repeat protein n=1 Tax=Roseobacter insulae TaxID=2859783 RepID=A0A9X1FVI4_9RHOB|nr:tetratricopeptide repeat protein [Roseobacter insulae]MBW4707648.1 tetratricopeptide repeat protein [Roseobacter insulae]